MANITLSKNSQESFSAIAMTHALVAKLKRKAPEGGQLSIELKDFNHAESHAIFSLLTTAYMATQADHITGHTVSDHGQNAERTTINIPGVGKTTSSYNISTTPPYDKTTHITLEVSQRGAPETEAMHKALEASAEIFKKFEKLVGSKYSAILSGDANAQSLQLSFLEPIVRGRGHRMNDDISARSIAYKGEQKPAILIKTSVLDDMIKHEATAERPLATQATISINKYPSAVHFSAYKAVQSILAQAKDQKSPHKNFILSMTGLEPDEVKAVVSLLALGRAAADNNTAEKSIMNNDKAGTYSILIPKIGSIVSKYNPDKKTATISIPAFSDHTLHSHTMGLAISTSKRTLAEAKISTTFSNDAPYYSIAHGDPSTVQQLQFTVQTLLHAHGHKEITDMATGDNPAEILVSKPVLDDILEKEGIGRERLR